jgi:hypothetical protein
MRQICNVHRQYDDDLLDLGNTFEETHVEVGPDELWISQGAYPQKSADNLLFS